MNAEANVRVEKLHARLQKKAEWLAHSSPEYDQDDLYQYMAQVIIEKANSHPEFLDQKDAYIVKYASWKASHLISHSITYLKYVDDQEKMTPIDTRGRLDFNLEWNEDEVDNTPIANDLTPEQALIEAEAQAELLAVFDALSDESRDIITMLYQGFSKAEIALKMGVSKPAITQRVQTVARRISPLYN
jgi:RNA polymerase sigma factor (sigma-70 family)